MFQYRVFQWFVFKAIFCDVVVTEFESIFKRSDDDVVTFADEFGHQNESVFVVLVNHANGMEDPWQEFLHHAYVSSKPLPDAVSLPN